MDSDGDEDFVATAPTTKKVKKTSGEEKGKKGKKGSVNKDPVEPSSPKRKTPKRKNEPKEESKKGKAKGKAKKTEEENESTAIGEEDEFNDGTENFNPNEESQDFDEDEEFEEKPKKKSVSKSEKKPAAKPKKEKAGAAKDTDQDEILEYMKKQNRPYSIINIHDNLHGKINKKNMQKALDTLTEEGLLQAKEFGKNKVWLLNQQNIPQINAQELSALTENLNTTKKEHDKIAEDVKELNTYLKNLQNQLSNEDLENEILKYQQLVEESGEKLAQFESGDYPQISDEDMKKAEEKKKQMEMECKKRKKMCMEMLNHLADGMELKVANVMEMVGIEID